VWIGFVIGNCRLFKFPITEMQAFGAAAKAVALLEGHLKVAAVGSVKTFV